MKVCLLIPSWRENVNGSPPLGVAYMASALEQHGHQVRIFDWTLEPGLSFKERMGQVSQANPDIIGLTVPTGSYPVAQKAIAQLKKEIGCPVVFGGSHAALHPRSILLENRDLDFVIPGEGQEVLIELLAALEKPGAELEGISGLLFRHKGTIIDNLNGRSSIDFNSLFPAFHLFELERYALTHADGSFMLPLLIGWKEGAQGDRWPRRPVGNVIAELRYNYARYNSRAAWFIGQPFSVNDPWAGQFTQSIIDRRLGIQWRCRADVARVTPRFLGQMRHAGCRQVDYFFQLEGASLDDKDYLDKLRKNVTWTAKLDIKSEGHFEIGRPGDSEEKIREIVRFATSLDLDQVEIRPYCPAPKPLEWNLIQEQYIATGQTAWICQAFYDTDQFHNGYPAWLNGSDISYTRLIDLAQKGRKMASEAKRRKKYELYFGKKLGMFLWQLSHQRSIRFIGRRIVDWGVFSDLRMTTGESKKGNSARSTAQNVQDKELPLSSSDKQGASASVS